jgi:cation transport regulator ChaB
MADQNFFVNYILSALLRKIYVPGEYSEQVKAVKGMLGDDVSGVVDSLTDFSVQSASVDFSVETDNDTLSEIFKKWLDLINKDYVGIPTGINPLSEEYFKERWKYSSFPILKLAEWEDIGDNFIVPTKMFFVDGEDVKAKPKGNEKEIKLVNYDYYLGDPKNGRALKNNVIITNPYGRWYDKYPTPYLIKRGVYHNWKLVEALKNMQGDIVTQIIPYMLLIKKGSENLALQKDIGYSDEQLQGVVDEFKDLVTNYHDFSEKTQSMVRATNYDEELKHLIPDLSTIFKRELFIQSERNIVSGLGFIDVEEAVSNSRKESVLNPKGFITECKTGIKDFKQIMKELVIMVMDANAEKHKKFKNVKTRIVSSPMTTFMTDKFKERIRQLYGRGLLSKRTTTELAGELDYETEKARRIKEEQEGDTLTMYPPVEQNREGVGIDFQDDDKNPPTNQNDKVDTKEDVPDDKSDPQERQNYDVGGVQLEGAPYKTVQDLPKQVKSNLNLDLQRVFLKVFNGAYDTYENDTMAMRVAWSAIKKIAKKNKKGLWVRKTKKIDGKKQELALTTAMLEDILDKEEKQAIDEAMAMRKLENIEGKKGLISKLMGKNK